MQENGKIVETTFVFLNETVLMSIKMPKNLTDVGEKVPKTAKNCRNKWGVFIQNTCFEKKYLRKIVTPDRFRTYGGVAVQIPMNRELKLIIVSLHK